MDDAERLRRLERQLADLTARLPRHTVRPAMLIEMEGLEEEIAALRAKLQRGGGADAEGAA